MTEGNLRPILLVEDDSSDANLLCRAFEKAHVLNRVIHLPSGDEALGYLAGVKEYADRTLYPLPALILLDLKLPGLTGMQLLQWKRAHENVRRIPVVVLTGDKDPQTVAAAYDLGANSYLVKRAKSSEILTMVKAIDQYWVKLNEDPLLVTGADAGG
ncbi:MAG TPA: response regulator [Terriglobales bacterium]|jgi:DNA-binding response OmpR family regulator|nr:response regulator [Terriglobales bacterium]